MCRSQNAAMLFCLTYEGLSGKDRQNHPQKFLKDYFCGSEEGEGLLTVKFLVTAMACIDFLSKVLYLLGGSEDEGFQGSSIKK